MKAYYNEKFHYLHTKTEDLSTVISTDHVHTRYEILYYLDGEADYMIGGDTYHLLKRDLILVQPGLYHRLIPNENFAYERICLHFDTDCIPRNLLDSVKEYKPIIHISKYSAIDNVFTSLLNAEYQDKFNFEDVVFLILQAIGTVLTHLKYLQSQDDVFPMHTNGLVSGILEYIDQNINKQITITTLSKAFYKSPSSISHMFTSVMKVPIKQYVISKKIVYAQSLIRNGENPTSVALKLSFKDYSTFFKAYKRVLGVKPIDDAIKG